MVYPPETATKYIPIGNRHVADIIARSFGERRLKMLLNDLSYNNLKTGSNRIVLDNGVEVVTRFNHGLTEIEVYAPDEVAVGPPDERLLCFCDCAITAGQVVYSPARGSVEPAKWIPSSNTKYTCAVCRDYHFVDLPNILAIDFFPHRDSEPEMIDGEPVPTRGPDNVYGLIGENDVEVYDQNTGSTKTVHKRLPDLSACSWKPLFLISIEPLLSQVGLARAMEDADY